MKLQLARTYRYTYPNIFNGRIFTVIFTIKKIKKHYYLAENQRRQQFKLYPDFPMAQAAELLPRLKGNSPRSQAKEICQRYAVTWSHHKELWQQCQEDVDEFAKRLEQQIFALPPGAVRWTEQQSKEPASGGGVSKRSRFVGEFESLIAKGHITQREYDYLDKVLRKDLHDAWIDIAEMREQRMTSAPALVAEAYALARKFAD